MSLRGLFPREASVFKSEFIHAAYLAGIQKAHRVMVIPSYGIIKRRFRHGDDLGDNLF
jgi:hypothetical protein